MLHFSVSVFYFLIILNYHVFAFCVIVRYQLPQNGADFHISFHNFVSIISLIFVVCCVISEIIFAKRIILTHKRGFSVSQFKNLYAELRTTVLSESRCALMKNVGFIFHDPPVSILSPLLFCMGRGSVFP
jgi:hypothetical protein